MDLFPATKFAPLIGVTVNVLQGCAFIEHCVPQLSGSTCLTFFYFFIFTIHIHSPEERSAVKTQNKQFLSL
jgi:hypothetical protein